MRRRNLVLTVAAVYLAIGFTLGGIMEHYLKPMNWKGVTYYALTWPGHVAKGSGLIPVGPPIPEWSFSFD